MNHVESIMETLQRIERPVISDHEVLGIYLYIQLVRRVICNLRLGMTDLFREIEMEAAQRRCINFDFIDEIMPPELYMGEEDQSMTRCAFCMDDIVHDATIRRLPCRHVYHRECVDKWISMFHEDCPVCRVSMYKVSPPQKI